jgi:hypothetical protein
MNLKHLEKEEKNCCKFHSHIKTDQLNQKLPNSSPGMDG